MGEVMVTDLWVLQYSLTIASSHVDIDIAF